MNPAIWRLFRPSALCEGSAILIVVGTEGHNSEGTEGHNSEVEIPQYGL